VDDARSWLVAEMQARGLRQVDLGRILGLDQSTTSKVFGGSRRLTGDELVQVMRWFGYDMPSRSDGVRAEIEEIIELAKRLDPRERRALRVYLEALSRESGKHP
jgi:transcriptional regulator with XRE-family HTH domain